MQYKCEICDKEYDSLWGLSSHDVKKHKIKPQETFIKHNEDVEKINTMVSLTKNLLENSKDIESEFVDIVNDNFWDLI